eukprot:1799284-Prymnesium_polylepis.1
MSTAGSSQPRPSISKTCTHVGEGGRAERWVSTGAHRPRQHASPSLAPHAPSRYLPAPQRVTIPPGARLRRAAPASRRCASRARRPPVPFAHGVAQACGWLPDSSKQQLERVRYSARTGHGDSSERHGTAARLSGGTPCPSPWGGWRWRSPGRR